MSKAAPVNGVEVSVSDASKLAKMLLKRQHYIERIQKIDGLYQKSRSPTLFIALRGYIEMNSALEMQIERLRPGTINEDNRRLAAGLAVAAASRHLVAAASPASAKLVASLEADSTFKNKLDIAIFRGGPGNTDRAIAMLEKAVHKNGAKPNAALSKDEARFEEELNIAMFRGRPGNTDRAIKLLEESLRRNEASSALVRALLAPLPAHLRSEANKNHKNHKSHTSHTRHRTYNEIYNNELTAHELAPRVHPHPGPKLTPEERFRRLQTKKGGKQTKRRRRN